MDVSTILNPALEMTKPAQQRVAETLFQWLAGEAVKKPLPDLDTRLVAMQAKLRAMATGLKLEMAMGKPVVSVSGDGHGTWCLFKRGSAWFEAHPNPELAVLVAVLAK